MKHRFSPWRKCCVYTITHKSNGSAYVGITTNKVKRWSEHRKNIEKDWCPDTKFYRALKKHGVAAFDWSIVCWQESEHQAKLVEIEMIQSGKFSLNTTLGGDGLNDPTGKIREKIRNTLTGRKLTDSHKKSISDGIKVWSSSGRRPRIVIQNRCPVTGRIIKSDPST